ncbi:alpha/beta hydrolase [Roseiterribacter gracilis]|uniref:Phospholipase n=1 Tax=Roseiterribacter gracilis TaxID=2812848 RepID=A0A8S8XC32_9PROT|nr:phospholipase [Rhodospirillales bacterium TMPK1]
MTAKLDGPSLLPAAGGKAKHIVVLLHGYGADGHDLLGLAPSWAPSLPDAVFYAPNAHERCEVGFGFQWFSLEDRSPARMVAGVEAAAPVFNAWLDARLAEHGLDESACALVGFSQGTMVALHVGLRRAKPLAGILGFSGALIAPEKLPAEIKSRPKVMLVHGTADQVVPAGALSAAVKGLDAAGISAQTLLRPGLGHGIDAEGMTRGLGFLKSVLG